MTPAALPESPNEPSAEERPKYPAYDAEKENNNALAWQNVQKVYQEQWDREGR